MRLLVFILLFLVTGMVFRHSSLAMETNIPVVAKTFRPTGQLYNKKSSSKDHFTPVSLFKIVRSNRSEEKDWQNFIKNNLAISLSSLVHELVKSQSLFVRRTQHLPDQLFALLYPNHHFW